MKYCPHCKDSKPLNEWSKSPNVAYCKKCWKEVSARYREVHRAKYGCWNKNKDEYNLMRKRGGKSQYEHRFDIQGGVCAICGNPERSQRYKTLTVDHCHKSGKIRSLLCSNCNRALGLFGEDPNRLHGAIRYLKQHSNVPSLVYLAVPYSHPEHCVRVARFMAVNKVAAKLMAGGEYVFSPISHTHPIAEESEGKLPVEWDFWSTFDKLFIINCKKIIVLQIPGWEQSKGVQAEIKIGTEMGIPVEYMDWDMHPSYEDILELCKVQETLKRT